MSSGAFTWRCCDGKIQYSAEGAKARAERLNAQRVKRGPMVRWYECPVCGQYHLGCRRHSGRRLRRGGV
jgi:hypothetical protein